MTQQIVIITGMHRSGTSLVASLLQEAGLSLGQNLIAPDLGNPRGHFEEAAFVQFHDQILQRLEQDILVQTPLTAPVNETEIPHAQQLITQYNQQPLWGWKDPRTSLFLDFWHSLLPQARYLFIYRHPLEVTLSLLRRGTDLEALADPLAGLQSWLIYNQAIAKFYQQYPNQCILAHVGAIVTAPQQFEQLLAQKLNLTLPRPLSTDRYAAEELRQNNRLAAAWSWRQAICPETEAWYQQLQALADLPAPPEPPAAAELKELESGKADPTMTDSVYRLLIWLDPETMSRHRHQTHQVIQRWRAEKRALAAQVQQLTIDNQLLTSQQQQTQANLTDQLAQNQHLRHQLEAMQATKGWRLLQRYWRARDWLKHRLGL